MGYEWAEEPEDAGGEDHPDNLPELVEIHELLEATGDRPVPEGATGEAEEVDPDALREQS